MNGQGEKHTKYFPNRMPIAGLTGTHCFFVIVILNLSVFKELGDKKTGVGSDLI